MQVSEAFMWGMFIGAMAVVLVFLILVMGYQMGKSDCDR